MPAERVPMRSVREILRLRAEGLSDRAIARSTRLARRTVRDYAGQTVELVDGRTGEVRIAQVFVAVLGASSYTYAEATWTQTLPDWIGAHGRALAFFGSVPRQIVPDNLKAGVLKAN